MKDVYTSNALNKAILISISCPPSPFSVGLEVACCGH